MHAIVLFSLLCLQPLEASCRVQRAVAPVRIGGSGGERRLRGGSLLDGLEDEADDDDVDDLGLGPPPSSPAAAPAASAEADTPPADGLTAAEVTEKLNAVPAFVLIANGQLLGSRNEEGEAVLSFFTDAVHARAVLASVKDSGKVEGAQLSVLPLGRALEACGGWAKGGGSEETRLSRLVGSPQGDAEFGEHLQKQLEATDRAASSWRLPLFLSNSFQTESMIPVFLSREDLLRGWERAGGDKEKPPNPVMVMDVRVFCDQLQSGMPLAKKIQLVSSLEAFELAKELNPKSVGEPTSS